MHESLNYGQSTVYSALWVVHFYLCNFKQNLKQKTKTTLNYSVNCSIYLCTVIHRETFAIAWNIIKVQIWTKSNLSPTLLNPLINCIYISVFCILHNCWLLLHWHFLFLPPVRLTDLSPAGKTKVAPRTLPPALQPPGPMVNHLVCVCVRVCVYVCFCVYVWGGRHSFNRYIIIISIVKLVNIIKAGDICSGTSVNIVKVMSNVKQVNFVNKKNLEILKKREESASVPTSHTNTFMVFVKLGACCFSDSWKFMS